MTFELMDSLQSDWHKLFGHPRPWRVLDNGTYCAGCGEEIRSF